MTNGPTLDLDPDDEVPALTPETRRRAVAAILAAGLIRLHERAALPTEPAAEKSQHLVQKGLEKPG
jgi:hypothetical protein